MNKLKLNPIGIFDSGLGGLTVLKAFNKVLPNEQYIYLGDTAHVPYGNKSKQSILKFTTQIVKYLEKRNVKIIIVACNTVSSIAMHQLKKTTKIPIIDVIIPLTYYFKNRKDIKRVGVIGTDNTIRSLAYTKLIKTINPKSKVYEQACPLLVPIIEAGLHKHKITSIMVKEYLEPLIKNRIQYLILGCTHYPLLSSAFKKHLPAQIKIIDSASITAKYIQEKYKKRLLLQQENIKNHNLIYVTDKENDFQKLAKKYFNFSINEVKKINFK